MSWRLGGFDPAVFGVGLLGSAEEGIPLYLVSRQSTAEAFLAAPDHAGVRSLLTTRARSITADCTAVWTRYRTPRTEEWVIFLEADEASSARDFAPVGPSA